MLDIESRRRDHSLISLGSSFEEVSEGPVWESHMLALQRQLCSVGLHLDAGESHFWILPAHRLQE